MATLLTTNDKKLAWMAEYNTWMVSQNGAKAETAKCAAVLAELALAKEQRCLKWTEHTVELAALVLAKEQTCHEAAEHAAVLVERSLANARCHRKVAECGAMLAKTALAAEQR